MKASDLFLKCLEEQGVTTIFGVPGEENADLMISLLDSPIEFITCRHEQGAAFMADIYGRLTGSPGVALSTLGPGATNLVTGIANANMDRSPVVAVVGQGSMRRLHKESHQNMDSVAMFQPITKWSHSIWDQENIPEMVAKAFKLAVAEKPGATMIELPENIAKRETDGVPFGSQMNIRRPAPDAVAIKQAVQLIRKAESPIILAGNGCVRTRAANALLTLVNKTGLYVVNTFMGKGALSPRHDQCLYTGGFANRDHVSEAFDAADLIITIGYDMVEWHPSIWNADRDKKIVHIDFVPAEVDEHYRCDVEVVGDIGSTLETLASNLDRQPHWVFDTFYKERLHMIEEHNCWGDDDSFPIKPQRILYDLRSVMRDEDILISDVGAHKMWVARYYPAYLPGTCIISNGFCSMGIAMPGAISAKKLFPEKNVVGLMGDGGYLMNIQELATAVQYKIPAVFLVWEDKGFGLIKWKQEMQFGRSSHVTFENPDITKVAEAFGCQGIQVQSTDQFIPAMKKAFATTDRPTVVNVPVDYSENLKLTTAVGELTCWL